MFVFPIWNLFSFKGDKEVKIKAICDEERNTTYGKKSLLTDGTVTLCLFVCGMEDLIVTPQHMDAFLEESYPPSM